MPAFTVTTPEETTLELNGELIAETEAIHQVEARAPLNTETVQIYRLDDGRFLLYQWFHFEDMDPHGHELIYADSPQQLVEAVKFPTEAAREMLVAVGT